MRRARFAKDPVVDRALRHSVRDGMAFSVAAGGGETYFSAFALFLKATAPQVALLTTLPPLIGSLAQLLSAWAGRFASRKRLVLAGAGVQALTWLPLLTLPYFFAEHAVALLLALFILYHAGGNFAAPQWTSLMRDLVSDRRRGRYFGYRTRRTTITSFVALVACGLLLHLLDARGETYLGFVVIFAIAFVARGISVYHLTYLHEPPPSSPGIDVHLSHWWQTVKDTGAVGFTVYYALMNFAVGIASPFFAVYMLRDLELSYFQFTVLTGASVFLQFLTLNGWGRIADVYGNRGIMIVTSMTLPIVPLLWLVSGNFYYLVVAQCISGLTWAGFTLSAGNLLYDLVPRSRRAAYVAFHNVGNAACVFLGAMLGAALAGVMPAATPWLGGLPNPSNLLWLFALSGVVRGVLAVGFVHDIREIRKPRRAISAPALVLRITGFNAMLGLIYDFIGRAPSAADPPREAPAEHPQAGRLDDAPQKAEEA
ncbi:MAG: MFS transporter [Gammaproteobacteria bacterium]|nr:hypothetical protein [Gammaproteobacteria bacterium]